MPNDTRKVGTGGTALRIHLLACGLIFWLCAGIIQADAADKFRQPLADGVFPIAVWLQQPEHAQKYRGLGINLYVGLWKGPTPAQLASLKRASMPVICEQNESSLTDPNRDVIVGWLQQDEPDNAQPLIGKIGAASMGWGSPVSPAEMLGRYRSMQLRDATRPVLLGLGKGVAWDAWKGRGNRTSHPEDYPEYVKAGDIVAFDIYPAAETDPALTGKLEVVAQGVKRLVQWAGPDKTVWNTIGASRVNNHAASVDPEQIRAQIWMSIINGSRGIIYFVHQFKPNFVEATWFNEPELATAIRKINQRIQTLAKAILSPASNDVFSASIRDSHGTALPAEHIAITSRREGCTSYVFAASLTNQPLKATIRLRQLAGSAEVLDENRSLMLEQGKLEDHFAPYAVHLYAIPLKGKSCPG